MQNKMEEEDYMFHWFTHGDKLVVFQLDDVSDLDVHPFLAPQSENRKRAGDGCSDCVCVCVCVCVETGLNVTFQGKVFLSLFVEDCQEINCLRVQK